MPPLIIFEKQLKETTFLCVKKFPHLNPIISKSSSVQKFITFSSVHSNSPLFLLFVAICPFSSLFLLCIQIRLFFFCSSQFPNFHHFFFCVSKFQPIFSPIFRPNFLISVQIVIFRQISFHLAHFRQFSHFLSNFFPPGQFSLIFPFSVKFLST